MIPAAAVRRALARAEAGKALDREEIATLLQCRGPELEQLSALGARLRDVGLAALGRPGVITYSRNVFIPVTRLCRDRCHYCTFVRTPNQTDSLFLEADEVLRLARHGAALGCTEALFTLGDRPEDRWPEARAWLSDRGYDSTLDYTRALAVKVLEETGLLPHLNSGVMTWAELHRLRPVAASMGMMLETTARRLFDTPGQCHYGSPDKDPTVRLEVLENAGRLSIPFTTGLLVGIGETYHERAESILALRRSSRRHRHVQEVIVQNFRAKDHTVMRRHPDLAIDEYVAAIATVRVILGPSVRIQAPPNLSQTDELARLVGAGVDDWGGLSPLTPDHVNPERPWPHLDELARRCNDVGFSLQERLAIHPEYILSEGWLDSRVRPHVEALAGIDGLVRAGATPVGLPWQESDTPFKQSGRTALHLEIDQDGRHGLRRADYGTVYGDWADVAEHARVQRPKTAVPPRSGTMRRDFVQALGRAADGHRLDIGRTTVLLEAREGPELDRLAALADEMRRDAVGDRVTFVVTRNINFTNVCYVGCRFCAFAQRKSDVDSYSLSLDEVADRAREAWEVGATETCVQGGIHPDLPGTGYFEIAHAIKSAAPEIHLHAYSPMEVVNGATRANLSIREWLVAAREAGVDSLPGTAAEILDDDVRWVLTKGKLPTASWVEVVTTAHDLGIPTTSTMMFGHVDEPRHWAAHLHLLAQIQRDHGGFTEFVPLPFVHNNSPIYLAGIARPGPTDRDNRAVHAVARIVLNGLIDNIQASWVKMPTATILDLLNGGVNDLGGTLMEETISRMAGSQQGSSKSIAEFDAVAARAGRPLRQRTTLYSEPDPERAAVAAQSGGVLRRPTLPVLDLGHLPEQPRSDGAPKTRSAAT